MEIQKKPNYKLIYIFIATIIIIMVFEFINERLVNSFLLPWQSFIISILITSFLSTYSIYLAGLGSWINSINLIENKNMPNDECIASFRLTLSAVNHIVNNVFNNFQFIQLDIEQYGHVNNKTVIILNESIKRANIKIELLNKIQNPSDPESYVGIIP